MERVRIWLPSVVVGLVVSICGVGVAEVAGLTPDPAETSARPTTPAKPEPSPAQVEVGEAMDVADRRSPSIRMETGEQEPEPAPDFEEESEAESEPESEQELEQESEPEPEPEPAPVLTVPPVPSPGPTPSPTVELATPESPPPPTLPAQLLDLASWKLTLPTGASGSPTEVRQPQLGQFSAPGVFWLDGSRQGVVFRAAAGGVTTENSSYPRAELREMNSDGSDEAAWSNAAGEHVLEVTQAITATPQAKPHVVAAQVHDAEDDVIMIRLEGSRLFVESDGDDIGVLDADYQLGTTFTVEIKATPAGITVSYNGAPVVTVNKVSEGLYFKAGCYTQSNPSKGDSPDAYGEVVIYGLTVRHSMP